MCLPAVCVVLAVVMSLCLRCRGILALLEPCDQSQPIVVDEFFVVGSCSFSSAGVTAKQHVKSVRLCACGVGRVCVLGSGEIRGTAIF